VCEFGNFCLLLALCLSLYALFAAVAGALQKQHRIVRSAERAALAASAGITLAMVSMLFLLAVSDFSVSHVASASSRDLPLYYKIAALWGAHDGSMLLWVFVTSVFSGIVIFQNRFRYRDMMPYVVAILMLNLSFFLALNLFLSNPFNRLVAVGADGTLQRFTPADGRGLNPLLQYWAMVIHPPILYFGFIGFVVPFAFAMGALITRQRGDAWIRTTRRWSLVTWLFLGTGLILGAKWAYVVLGWGGYWAWDPVENSSLMPWLIGTAFLHSVTVQERRGMMKVWNVFLVVLMYLLGVFGTFITRSGIVNSVHAFADSPLGNLFIYYMAAIACASLALIYKRLPDLKSDRPLDSFLSRESAFLFNNLIMVVACFSVLWGTMFPVLSEYVRGNKITVGPPYFNRVNIPIGLFLLLLMGVGPLFAWRKTSLESLKKAFFRPAIAAALACAAVAAGGVRSFYATACFGLCAFVAVTILEEFYKGARVRMRNQGENFAIAVVNLTLKNKRRYGGYIVHFAVILIFVGLAGNAFNIEQNQLLSRGEEMKIGSYTLVLTDYKEADTANYRSGTVTLQAFKDGKLVRTLRPERRAYRTGDQQTTTEVALYSTPKEDLYAVFAGASDDGRSFQINAFVNPLVWWVWFGAGIMFLGTLLTLLPDRKAAALSTQLLPLDTAILEQSLKLK
jgi:cytochrome c-type biogenesis protein CcmF